MKLLFLTFGFICVIVFTGLTTVIIVITVPEAVPISTLRDVMVFALMCLGNLVFLALWYYFLSILMTNLFLLPQTKYINFNPIAWYKNFRLYGFTNALKEEEK